MNVLNLVSSAFRRRLIIGEEAVGPILRRGVACQIKSSLLSVHKRISMIENRFADMCNAHSALISSPTVHSELLAFSCIFRGDVSIRRFPRLDDERKIL